MDNALVTPGQSAPQIDRVVMIVRGCAVPLWAGFTALVNQLAAALGNAPVGFINPAIHSLGYSAGYGAFHDITTGNNTNSASHNLFYLSRTTIFVRAGAPQYC
jgi:hypothetical protein